MSLPAIEGTYTVGATSFKLLIREPVTIGPGQYHASTGELVPALKLEEVAFTAYYPAAPVAKYKSIHWLLRPLDDSIVGLSRFSTVPTWLIRPIVHIFGRFLTIPVSSNAPLLKPRGDAWPLVIFSHGLGGSSRAYSHICGRIAASGRVVIALGHADGTSPTTDGQPNAKFYFRDHDITWGTDSPDEDRGPLPIRTDQLKFRRLEIYHTYNAVRSLVENGSHPDLQVAEDAFIDWESWTAGAPIECKSLAGAGHSFGGATWFSILSNPPPSDVFRPLPITHTLLLDPWLEPFSSPGPMPFLDESKATSNEELQTPPSLADEHTPRHSEDGTAVASMVAHKDAPKGEEVLKMLIMNSEQFSLWKSHFKRLQGIVGGWEPNGRRLVTLVRSQHAAFSDFPILPAIPGRSTGKKLLDVTAELSLAFLDDRTEEGLKAVSTRELELEEVKGKKGWDGETRLRMVGKPGDVVIH